MRNMKNVIVYKNDCIDLEQISMLNPDKIVISPGPGRPEDAGISLSVVRTFGESKSILGVCLGHQCIGEVFGAKIVEAKNLMHGKTSLIYHLGKDIYHSLENPFVATRYHSLIIKDGTLPSCLMMTAWTREGKIMGIRHKEYPVFGVQFHPESILTNVGMQLLKNFLRLKECIRQEIWHIPR